jgi:hypothetical protein
VLQNQLLKLLLAKGIKSVDLVTGGGKFHMLLKVIIRFSAKPSITCLFEIANVNRITSLQIIEQKKHIKIVSFYDDEK